MAIPNTIQVTVYQDDWTEASRRRDEFYNSGRSNYRRNQECAVALAVARAIGRPFSPYEGVGNEMVELKMDNLSYSYYSLPENLRDAVYAFDHHKWRELPEPSMTGMMVLLPSAEDY